MDITTDKFNNLSPLNQATLIWQHAVPVGELYDKLYAYALYQLFDFYVEVKFCKANFVLHEMCAFSTNCSHLDLYIKEIDISPVLYAS
jgi:hypothetical protein